MQASAEQSMANDGPSVSTARATFMLVMVAMVLGLSFSLVKRWHLAAQNAPVSPLLAVMTLIALRLSLASIVLAVWQPRLFLRPGRRAYWSGALIGGVFILALGSQAWGLAWTTPAMSAFFISLSSAWVPLLGWLCLGLRVARGTVLGLGVALAGTAVLVEGGWRVTTGDGLTLIASVLVAVQILLVDRLGKKVPTGHLSAGIFVFAASLATVLVLVLAWQGPGLAVWAEWIYAMLRDPKIVLTVALLVLLPTLLGFYWMNTYQPFVPPSRAALVYLLEPVFASLYSFLLGHDSLTLSLICGGGLIVLGNLLVELPRLLTLARAEKTAWTPPGQDARSHLQPDESRISQGDRASIRSQSEHIQESRPASE